MKLIIPLFLLSCQPEPAIKPDHVVIAVETYGDTERYYIENNGIECWVFYDGEFVRKERY
jgi:hypothetical protein